MATSFYKRVPSIYHVPSSLQFQLDREIDSVRPAAIQLRKFLELHSILEADLWACELAFVEACNNAIKHASATAPDFIDVEITCENGTIELRIFDQSPGLDLPETISLPPNHQETGRGLFLMKSLMDHVRLSPENCLILTKTLTGI